MKIAGIHQPQYLPYLGFFHKLRQCDIFIMIDDVDFSKNSFQNRNKIKNDKGYQWLTVPVLHNLGQTIKEVRIKSKEPWQRKHWHALVANYSRSPFFKAYSQKIHELLQQQWDSLCELDLALMSWVMEVLAIRTRVVRSSELNVEGSRTELLLNLCKAVGARSYLSGPGGRRYLDLKKAEEAGIAILWQQFTSPIYPQVFPGAGFIPDLSVVDAIFSCGPETQKLLE